MREVENDDEYRKLCWRSRRGMLELDRLLAPFTQDAYLHLNEQDKIFYQMLLEQEDTDLLDWLVYHLPPAKAEWLPLINKIIQYVPTH